MANKVEVDATYGTSTDIYHEKQVRQLCAIHSINNVLQRRAFVQKDFDKICYE